MKHGYIGEFEVVDDMLLANKVRAPAKAGALAPLDVMVHAQNTRMGPEMTSFFQALNIATKLPRVLMLGIPVLLWFSSQSMNALLRLTPSIWPAMPCPMPFSGWILPVVIWLTTCSIDQFQYRKKIGNFESGRSPSRMWCSSQAFMVFRARLLKFVWSCFGFSLVWGNTLFVT